MSHDLNDADVHLSDYHRQLFGRANRYYAALAAGANPRYRRRSWPVVAAFTLGSVLSFLLATLILPGTAAALPDRLSRPVALTAPASRVAADVALIKRDAAKAAAEQAIAAARRAAAAARKAAAARRLAIVLASEDQNPLRAVSALAPERIDAGVDFGGYGPVYALGPGVIYAIYNGGWPGGGWICELMTGGPHAGAWVYTAEAITPSVSVGEHVTSSTVIGSMQGYIETGWAQPGCAGNALAGIYGVWTPQGASYDSVLTGLGVPPPFSSTGAGPLVRTAHSASVSSSSRHHRCTWACLPRNRAMNWAITQKSHAYCWGGTGPCYDCSGLVMTAYGHAGFGLPRTTYGMLADVGVRHYRRHTYWVLTWTAHPHRGDLAFYGSGHVELLSKHWHETFGAHDYGSPVGWARWGYGWVPTAFYTITIHRR